MCGGYNMIKKIKYYIIISMVLLFLQTMNAQAARVIESSPGFTISAPSTANFTKDKTSKVLTAVFTPTSSKESVTWSTSNAKIVKISSTQGNSITISRVGEGVAVITAKTASGKISKYEQTVKEEKVLFVGASGTSLMAMTRKDGDTGQYQKINYGKLVKNKNLYFVSQSGSGIGWFLTNAQRTKYSSSLKLSTYYGKQYENGGVWLESILNSPENDDTKVHFSIALIVEGNDIKGAKSNESILKKQAPVYYEYYSGLAKKYSKHNFLVISKAAYNPKAKTAAQREKALKLNQDCPKFNKALKTLVDNGNIKNLKFRTFFTYTYNLYVGSDKKIGTTADFHPNQYTTQVYFDQILKDLGISK